MKQTLIMDLAKVAKQDGLTLPWCLTHLAEQIERNQRRSDQAVVKAYPAGADVNL